MARWILAHGHAALTPAEVARLLEVSRTWVSRRLGTRGAILLEVSHAMSQSVIDALAAIPPGLEPAEHLRRVVQAVLPKLPSTELAHAWGLLGETGHLWEGPVFYAVVHALTPWAGGEAASCAAAWTGIMRHASSSATPWTRRDIAGRLYAVAQGFRFRAQNGVKP